MDGEFFNDLISILGAISEGIKSTSWFDYVYVAIGILNFFVLFITLCFLKKYTGATERMKEEMIRQTELEQMPIIILYIRDIRDYMDDRSRYEEQEKYRRKFQDYIIRVNGVSDGINYFLRIRNVGKGAAFNAEVKIDDTQLEIGKYETRFFAPLNDEHSVQVSDLSTLSDLNGKIFIIYCEDAANIRYYFRYKIIDIENKKVIFLEKGKEVIG